MSLIPAARLPLGALIPIKQEGTEFVAVLNTNWGSSIRRAGILVKRLHENGRHFARVQPSHLIAVENNFLYVIEDRWQAISYDPRARIHEELCDNDDIYVQQPPRPPPSLQYARFGGYFISRAVYSILNDELMEVWSSYQAWDPRCRMILAPRNLERTRGQVGIYFNQIRARGYLLRLLP